MADINNIETIQDLIDVVSEYLVTPRIPKLTGAQLGIIIAKHIELGGGLPSSDLIDFVEETMSVYVNEVSEPPAEGGVLVVYGDSISGGTGGTGGQPGFANRLATMLGYSIDLHAGPASTLMNRDPINVTGASNLTERISSFPTRIAVNSIFLVEYGVNDIRYNGVNYTPANFKIDYTSVINGAIAKGWLASEIIIFSTTYVSPNSFNTPGTGGTPDITEARHLAFNQATLEVAEETGVMYFDAYNYIKDRGGDNLLTDNIHPNNLGHQSMAEGALAVLTNEIFREGQALAVNGISEFANIKYGTNYIVPDESYLLGVDPEGIVGKSRTLPDKVRAVGDMIIHGRFLQENAQFPNGDFIGLKDLLLLSGSKIIGAYSGSIYNFIEACDSSGHMNFLIRGNTYKYHFKLGQIGSEQEIFTITKDGISVENGDIYINVSGKFMSGYGENYGYFKPFGPNLEFAQLFNTSGIGFYISGGVTGNKRKAISVSPKGKMLIKYDQAEDEKAVNSARLQIDSTTEGFLLPRMTSAQRDAMSNILEITYTHDITSLYTTATIEITGGGGTGATATPVITDGHIFSAIITNPGTGYVTAPTVTVTGDGAGVTMAATLNLVKGLQIFNTTTNKINTYDGTMWTQPVTEAAT